MEEGSATTVFGIRHHGPGCARALLRALDEMGPDCLLVEGPPEGEAVLDWLLDEDFQPPAALLVYPPEAPSRGVFFPVASFSPEYRALRFGLEQGLEVRFMDLAQSIQQRTENWRGGKRDVGRLDAEQPAWQEDPLAVLAGSAGYREAELWWDEQIERRRDARGLFEAILEAMREVRGEAQPKQRREACREAAMRLAVHEARRDGFERIAVVCGAWHAPALGAQRPVTRDRRLLRGLKRRAVQSTWIPWNHARLSRRSGYGAGVRSPGWYAHVFQDPARAAARYLSDAASLLRREDLEASSGNVIEALRLAEALAAMRGLPSPGLRELNEAAQSVLCAGRESPMRLIRRRLEVGEGAGRVPEGIPAVPLRRDLKALQRRLRMRPSTEGRKVDLDLRKPIGLGRSHLLHRLTILGIPWGERQEVSGKSGTFHEVWRLRWREEFEALVIEASVWGGTVEEAARNRLEKLGREADDLAELTGHLDAALLAELPGVADPLLERIEGVAARGSQVARLMEALPPLSRVARYGNVRSADTGRVGRVVEVLFERVLAGLLAACSSLGDQAASEMLDRQQGVQEALALLDREDLREEWLEALGKLVDSGVHPLLRGGCSRSLLEQGRLSESELERAARLNVNRAVPAREAAAWIEGLLRGGALVLLRQTDFWRTVDDWLSGLREETFMELLPLLRRAWSDFSPAERRAMSERIETLHAPGKPSDRTHRPINRARARQVLPILRTLLGR